MRSLSSVEHIMRLHAYLCLVSFELSLLLGDFCLLSWQTTWFQLNQIQIYKAQGQEIA